MKRSFVGFSRQGYKFDLSSPSRKQNGSIIAEDDLPPIAEYFIDDKQIALSFGHTIAPLLADWIDVAVAVYFADRLAVRRGQATPRNQYQWGRKIHLKIGVRELQVWQQQEVSDLLHRLLYFITEDDWQIEFVERQGNKRKSEQEVQGQLFPLMSSYKPIRVALYSGGLDSFAGTAQQMSNHPNHQFVLVSGVTNSRQQAGQRRQVSAISQVVGNAPTHITVPYRRHWQNTKQAEEWSQRARGFLFLTLGITTALAAETQELYVYENGIGAINLPINGTQVGTFNSRAVNPITLARMAEFVRTLTGKSFTIHNPFLLHTKGEMCSHKIIKKLASYIPETFSCDGFPVHAKGRPQCGTCTSCLLRRVSIMGAGLTEFDPGSGYLVDLLSSTTKVSMNQQQNLCAMDWQARKINQSLKVSGSWNALIHDFPELRKIEETTLSQNGEDRDALRTSLLRLYEQYISEWDVFSSRCYVLNLRDKRVA
jgi:7-cyano-7-deazaguanine synthase in queuosine biosynthesis